MCLNDLFQLCAIAVHIIPDSFSCRHEKVSSIMWTRRSCFLRSIRLCSGRECCHEPGVIVHLFHIIIAAQLVCCIVFSRYNCWKGFFANHPKYNSVVPLPSPPLPSSGAFSSNLPCGHVLEQFCWHVHVHFGLARKLKWRYEEAVLEKFFFGMENLFRETVLSRWKNDETSSIW